MKKVKVTSSLQVEYSSKDLKKITKRYNNQLGIKISSKKEKNKKLVKKRKNLETGIHNALIGINCVIAGVPISLSKVNTKKKIKKVNNFVRRSTIDYSTKTYNPYDIMFKRKFVVICTSRIIKNEKKILNKFSKPYTGKKDYEKFRIIKDHEFFNTYMAFTANVIGSKKNVSDSLFDMFYILNKSDITPDINKYRFKVLKDMAGTYKQLFGRKKSYKVICDLFNMTLLLGSGSNTLKKFDYREFKGCTVEDDLEKSVRKLGRKIIKCGMSEMFLTYLQCNPKVRTMYIKEVRENQTDVIVGLLALSFTDYMFNQMNIHYMIRCLLRRPWTSDENNSSKK